MRNSLFVAITLFFLSSIAYGATIDMDTQSEELRVLSVEDQYVAAEVNGDEDTLRRIIDDDFVLNSGNGTTLGKEDLIKNILSWNLSRQKISERTIMIQGESAAIFGTAELVFNSESEKEVTSLMRYTSIYIKRQGQWRFWALHMSEREPHQ